MKVLHLLGWYFPDNVGGTEVYVAELARRQHAAGFDVSIAAPRVGIDHAEEYTWAETQVFRYPVPAAATRDEVQGVVPIPGHRDLVRWLERHRPAVVHVHTLSTGITLHDIRAARAAGAHVVFTAHLPALGFICQRGTLLRWGHEACDGMLHIGRCAACALQDRGMPLPFARAVAAVTRPFGASIAGLPGRIGTTLGMPALIAANRRRQQELVDLVAWFVVLNQRAKEIVLANGAPADKVTVNRLGVGFESSGWPPANRAVGSPVRVGFVGRLHPTKGVHVLARAVSELPPDAGIRLEILGPDGDPALVRTLKAAAARDPRIVLGPAVPRDQMAEALRRFDVLCCPSLWFENGPTVALEAQAVGTPVIGSDFGAIPEIVQDHVNGRVVPPGDWRALRAVLAELAANPSLITRWRHSLVRPRTMDDVSDDYLAMYGDLVGAA